MRGTVRERGQGGGASGWGAPRPAPTARTDNGGLESGRAVGRCRTFFEGDGMLGMGLVRLVGWVRLSHPVVPRLQSSNVSTQHLGEVRVRVSVRV